MKGRRQTVNTHTLQVRLGGHGVYVFLIGADCVTGVLKLNSRTPLLGSPKTSSLSWNFYFLKSRNKQIIKYIFYINISITDKSNQV